MKGYGLVLAGGGGKGAYQLGVWKALREMNIRFDAIAGASVGSINGAFIAADDYDGAVDMWSNISIDKGIKISETLPDPENLFSKKNWGTLLREFVKNGGIDASPMNDLLARYINEDKIRSSYIDFGLIAVQLSQPAGKYEFFLEDIPKGELISYLLASANVPFINNIGPDGEKYLDGGAYDNVPVMTLKKRGYNRLIVVDISNIKGVAHTMDILNSQITYIRPYDMYDLGGTFDFDKATIEKRILLGYYDAKKAFSLLGGKIYYFLPSVFRSMVIKYGADTIVELEELAFMLDVPKLEIYSAESFIISVKQAYSNYLEEKARKEAERNAKETEKEQEKESVLLKIRHKEKNETKENESSFIRTSLRKRFSSKASPEEYKNAIALLDNFII